MDTFVQEAIITINKIYGKELFLKSKMNLFISEDDIQELISDYVKKTYGEDKQIRSSKEDCLRAFNFIKPSNLLPSIPYKIYTIRFQAITYDGHKISICVNPYFYGFLISFVILLFQGFSGYSPEEVEDDLILILEQKYGADLVDIFWEVDDTYHKGANLARERGDKADESFIKEMTKISGVLSENDFEKYLYNPCINYCQKLISDLKP